MKPIDPGERYGQEIIYAKNQPEYLSLPARIDKDGGTFTLWELSWRERLAALTFGKLSLRILTFGHPLSPMHLGFKGTMEWPYEER